MESSLRHCLQQGRERPGVLDGFFSDGPVPKVDAARAHRHARPTMAGLIRFIQGQYGILPSVCKAIANKRETNDTRVVTGMNATQIVDYLLENTVKAASVLSEATVYLPPRSTRWVAVFTGAEPGKQVRKSTGLTDRHAALVLAKKWESEAREERFRSKSPLKKPSIRVGSTESPGLLTQKEVAAVLGMSERGVREVERRALSKLRKNKGLRDFWSKY